MEEFKIIKDYTNYSVSNFGNVKNNNTGKILKQPISNGYTKVSLSNDGKLKHFLVHRLIALAFIPNPDNKPFVDHIDNDRLNNNIDNLRWCTNQENSCNRQLTSKNTSGYKGVNFYKTYNCWRAEIKLNGKSHHIGYYQNIEDAVKARCEYAIKTHGTFINQCELVSLKRIELEKELRELEELEKELQELQK
jgi:hypothetical protein